MDHTVGEVARLAGITVHTLHHYDEIGLLSPSWRTAAGYRELGFGLDEIAAILYHPIIDPLEHLRRQHALLTDRVGRLHRQLTAIEKTMEAHQMGIQLSI